MAATPIEDAYNAGIPVITVNTSADTDSITAHVGSDDIEAGRLQMQRLIDVGPADLHVAYIDAVLGHSAQVFRAMGYQEILAANPQVTLVVNDTANWSSEEALRLVENWITAYPRIDAIAAHADIILLGAITAVENAGIGGEILLSGIDADMPVLEKIAEGVVDNTLWQDGIGQGVHSLRLAIEAAQGKAISDMWIPFDVITADNVAEYIQKAIDRIELAAQYFH
jgi:ABC-type sugar transport system substrate-binding protein